jgi:tetratricopeptide (TPR) repeat protein
LRTLPNKLATEALEVLERLRSLIPEPTASRLGTERLDATDWRVIRDCLGYSVQRRKSVDAAWCTVPGALPGHSILRITAGLPSGADRFVEAAYAAHLSAPEAQRWRRDTLEALAFTIILPRRERLERGRTWVREVRQAAQELTFPGEAPRILAAARHLARYLYPAHDRRRSAQRLMSEGKRLRDGGFYEPAECHFRQALHYAADAAEWTLACAAIVALGKSAWQRGNYPQATDWFEGAASVASIRGCAEQEGQAHHYLMVIAAKRGDEALVLKHFRRAYAAYGVDHHARVPVLLNDLAAFWLDLGKCHHALAVLREIGRRPPTDAELALAVHCNTAAAAAGCGQQIAYEVAACAALAVLETCGEVPCAAPALLEIAGASLRMGDAERASALAERGLNLARARRMGESIIQAEALLQAIADAAAHPAPQRQEPLPLIDSVAAFLVTLMSAE